MHVTFLQNPPGFKPSLGIGCCFPHLRGRRLPFAGFVPGRWDSDRSNNWYNRQIRHSQTARHGPLCGISKCSSGQRQPNTWAPAANHSPRSAPPVPNASSSRVARGKQADLSRRSTWKTPKSARHRHAAWSNPAGGTASENRSRARRRADSHCSRSAVEREWSLVEPRVETEVGIGEPSARPNSRRPPRGAKMCGASPQRKTVTGVHPDGIPSEVPEFPLVRRAVRTKSTTFQRNATIEIRIHEGRKGTLLRPSFGPVPRQLVCWADDVAGRKPPARLIPNRRFQRPPNRPKTDRTDPFGGRGTPQVPRNLRSWPLAVRCQLTRRLSPDSAAMNDSARSGTMIDRRSARGSPPTPAWCGSGSCDLFRSDTQPPRGRPLQRTSANNARPQPTATMWGCRPGTIRKPAWFSENRFDSPAVNSHVGSVLLRHATAVEKPSIQV